MLEVRSDEDGIFNGCEKFSVVVSLSLKKGVGRWEDAKKRCLDAWDATRGVSSDGPVDKHTHDTTDTLLSPLRRLYLFCDGSADAFYRPHAPLKDACTGLDPRESATQLNHKRRA